MNQALKEEEIIELIKEYLKNIESKCKEYAKKVLMQKYKNMLIKSLLILQF